jgi:hypothetical protein
MGQEVMEGPNVADQHKGIVNWKARLAKLGWIGFLLFLLKGIIWLAIGYLLVR